LNARRGQIHQFLRARKWEQALLEKSKDKEDSTKGQCHNGTDASAFEGRVIDGVILNVGNCDTLSVFPRKLPLKQPHGAVIEGAIQFQ
jgi:hypothetical protein